MILMLQPIDEGPLDTNRKSGDIVAAYDDSWEPSIGGQEKKSWLAVKVPNPTHPNGNPFPQAVLDQTRAQLIAQEYEPGPTPEANQIRRERKHSIPFFRQKFSGDELIIIGDANQVLPDGTTANGGTVANGVVSGLFAFRDIVRK